MSFRILIADDEPIIRRDLRELLQGIGHDVVAEAKDGVQALELVARHRPDVVIVDIKMPALDGIAVAREISAEYPVIVLTAFSSPDLILPARDAGVMAYLTKPFREKDIAPAIELAVTHFLRESHLGGRVAVLKQQLETRRLVDRAKGLIMDREGLSEAQAFRFMQKLSMESNIPMRDVAETIIGTPN